MAATFIEKWNRQNLLNYIDEFSKLYDSRPIKDNSGGMKSAHLLSACYIIKELKPKYIIESGVWKGLGTWFFEQISHNSKIISIDPSPEFRVYTSDKVKYQTTDFLQTDWSFISNQDKENTLLFFDDHQNFFERLQKAKSLGFKKVIDEDNYPYQQGDCYSPKKILSNKDYVMDRYGKREWFKKNDEDKLWLEENLSIYQEMPPIFKSETTRWGDVWNDINYPTPQPLLNSTDNEKYSLFYSEVKDYTWICYIELN